MICVNYSRYGSCSEGNKCRLRHPLKVCMKFLEGSCNQGDSCVTQHPMNQMSSGPRPASIVTPYMSPPLLPHPPQSSTEVPYPVPAFPSQSYHEGPPYPRSKSSSFSEFKSSTPPGPTNLYAPKQDFWLSLRARRNIAEEGRSLNINLKLVTTINVFHII